MARSLDSSQARQRQSVVSFSLRRHFYVPLMLSLPFSLPLTCAAISAIAVGWLPVIRPTATGETQWVAALSLIPQTFVVCVGVCWLIFGISLPLSGRWSGATEN